MADQTARDLLAKHTEMEEDRRSAEAVWEIVADFCDPDAPNQFRGHAEKERTSQAERGAVQRGPKVYDNTINSAANRLAAGLESLIIPQSEKWHGLTTAQMNDEETSEELEWAEGLRDFIFQDVRYLANSYFVPATQSVLRNIVRYGPAYLYSEEGFGGTLVRYASVPVAEAYIARDRWGNVDTFHRKYTRTARQCAQMFGYDKLPAKIRQLVDDPQKQMEKVSLLQCIKPRDERRVYRSGDRYTYLDAPFASYHVIEQEESIAKEGGFETFPVACFNWRRYEGDTYGISPTIDALTTVRETNAVRRDGLRLLQHASNPALAYRARAGDVPPVLNPGEKYPGLMSEDGRLLIAPITTGDRPDLAFNYANERAEEIRDMLFVNLFQILIQNPQMTATEALIRQEEKGALLGPSGSVIQSGFAANLDRELSILEAKGLYDEGSRFLPPASLAGKSVKPVFTSPLDVLRRAAESRDADLVVQAALQYAAASQDVSILDRIDGDEYLKIKKEASRAPQRLLRTDEEVEEMRAARSKAQQSQQGMAAMQGMAKAAKDAVPALQQARDSGMLQQLSAMQPQVQP